MTTPQLAHSTGYGRLYRRPDVDPSVADNPSQALASGLLVPSVTNVIDVMNKPYLNTWYAKRAAEDAVETARRHPGLMETKPDAAVKYLKAAAERTSNAAATLGDLVHQIVEAKALGQDVDVPEKASGYVTAWEAFVADFSPQFTHVEATCFGTTEDGLGYAGTADFIARINGQLVVGDYKTGRSIHTEAALQLAALADAEQITNQAQDALLDMPRVAGAVVLHLTPTGYSLRPVTDMVAAMESFRRARALWDFHQENLNSRSPLLIGSALRSPADVSYSAGKFGKQVA